MDFKKKLTLMVSLAALMGGAMAHGVKCSDLSIDHPYSKPTIGMSKVGAVYFNGITNQGSKADQLISARTQVAASVEIHEMAMVGSMMQMREVKAVNLPAGVEVSLKHGQPNGHHLMLMNLAKPLRESDKFSITLKFKRAGECEAEVWVLDPKVATDAH